MWGYGKKTLEVLEQFCSNSHIDGEFVDSSDSWDSFNYDTRRRLAKDNGQVLIAALLALTLFLTGYLVYLHRRHKLQPKNERESIDLEAGQSL